MAKIKWEINPIVKREDGRYDPTGATLQVAMEQAQALADIAAALDRISVELRYMRLDLVIGFGEAMKRDIKKAGERDGKETEGAV